MTGDAAAREAPAARPAVEPSRQDHHSRNLVVVRAGDASLHREWLAGSTRDFDIFVSYYGASGNRYRDDADYYEQRPGPKWPCIAELVNDNQRLIGTYDAVWFPDDDLSVGTDAINRLFAFFHAYRLNLAQPALTRNSYFTWNTLLQDPDCYLRFTGFVEVMAPLFSRHALSVCACTFAESRSGWGLDWVWPTLCADAGLAGIAVIDATPVWHTRPLGGELYRNHADLDPRADAERVIGRYGLQEIRAVAKYTMHGKVMDVPISRLQRLVFWMKRLNGRRRHRAGR